jgi:hypothetical protein
MSSKKLSKTREFLLGFEHTITRKLSIVIYILLVSIYNLMCNANDLLIYLVLGSNLSENFRVERFAGQFFLP